MTGTCSKVDVTIPAILHSLLDSEVEHGFLFSVINARNTRQVALSIVGLHPINNLGRNILHRHLLIV